MQYRQQAKSIGTVGSQLAQLAVLPSFAAMSCMLPLTGELDTVRS